MARQEILDVFTADVVLDYAANRVTPVKLGQQLFPETKVPGLEMDMIKAGSRVPVIASVHAFDSESEIASREGSVSAQELALIKRKIQIKERELVKLREPRNQAEQEFLMGQVFNDVEKMIGAVEARVELMRMDVLANGKVTINENGLNKVIDYGVSDSQKVTLTGDALWNSGKADIMGNFLDWANLVDVTPTRALTSSRVIAAMMKDPTVQGYFKTMGVLPSRAALNQMLESMGLPRLMAYDAKYRVQNADGTYTAKRYFPENKIVLLNDVLPGETIFGTTPEESRIAPQVSTDTVVGNVFATIYEETKDPIGTWTKASAVALPSFPEADNVVQATVLPASV